MDSRPLAAIRLLTTHEFPAGLSEIPQPPEKLWLRGTLPPEGTVYLSVVGSRALSRYGKEACEQLITGLAGYPISIVSGLALGTDSCAHRAALKAGLHTLAIPGSGLSDSVIYPRSNLGLAHEILESGGALLSEQEPDHKPWLKEFPSRNRLMVGMSSAVLMIEAGERSGTLITARLAGDYNRELLYIPHRIGDQNSAGIHQFLRLGATLVTEPAHILEALRITPREDGTRSAPQNLSESEQKIYDVLEKPFTRDELLRAVGLPPAQALSLLITLELKGYIKEQFGAWRRRT